MYHNYKDIKILKIPIISIWVSPVTKLKEFCESWRGLYGGKYYYVLEDGKCIHISKYAVKTVRKDDEVCYYVDEARISDKTGIHIISSGSGPIIGPEDVKLINKCDELLHLTPSERKFLEDWNKFYIPMLEYIRKEVIDRGKSVRVSNLLESHVKYLLKYPLSFFISYSSEARLRSFEVLTREIYEIWISLRILKELMVLDKLDFILFEQSSSIPVANFNNYSMWYEFDFTPNIMCNGVLQYYCGSFNIGQCRDRLPQWLIQIYDRVQNVLGKSPTELKGFRPDILFTQVAKSCHDLFKNPAINFKLVIECKNFDYEFWSADVDMQIIPYKKILQPEHILVVSLKPIPQAIKDRLNNLKVDVIDNVYPDSPGEEQLVKYIRNVFS